MTETNLHIIVGLGATGLSCAQYFHKNNIPFAMMDTRENPPQLASFQKSFPHAKVSLGELDAEFLKTAAKIILSPGIALSEPAIAEQVKRGIPVIGDIELFAQVSKAPVIAITGTNAKSTVTTLVGKMAEEAGYKVQVGGNLGVPALELLNDESANLFVLELSSFQLETTYNLKSKVATILNITPDHMDRYETIQDYQQAKYRIYNGCELAVCNHDDQLTEYKEASLQSKYYFTLEAPGPREFGIIQKGGNAYLAFETVPLLDVKELPIIGKHYQANALAALALGYGFGLSFEPMLKTLKTFKGLPHRCQYIRERRGVSWYNDSKGTNVGATQAAIEGLGKEIKGKLILIAGGVGKNADFSSLVPVIEKYTRHVVVLGEAADDLAKVIQNRVPVTHADSMQDAVNKAARLARASDSVLLSPACASFDMFKNFEHRGEVFTGMVEALE